MIGETISHYKIVEKLGRGGMGEVFKAEDLSLKRIVALKFLSPELILDDDARTRFGHEAQAASALQHHNICTIHEIDRTPDGRMFICMDYYTGGTLKARTDRGALPVAEAVDLAAQAAEGLARAHEAGMVHRDVKPANIAVTNDGVVKILDFGLAMLSDRTRVTKMGTTVGTVSYMSPEQAKGDDVTSRADVWSLGVILYEMLAGRLPFKATHDAAVVYAILNESHEPVASVRDDVPPELARIVEKALAKNPDERYHDAGEMAVELRSVAKELEGRDRTPVPGGAETDRDAGKGRARVWLPLALVALVVVVAFLVRPLLFPDEVVSAPRPIAVISFENRTGDPQYDYLREVIPNLLITSLEQSKYLSVVTWERMHDLLEQTGHADVTLIDKETGFEACRLDGIDTIVLGSFARAGDVFVTDVKILDVHSKELLKSVSAKGDGVGSILDNQIDELGEEISRGVGLSERLIAAAGSRPIAAVTTQSMEAYEYFLRGKDAWDKFYWDDALRNLDKAVELDSTFASAWAYLGLVRTKLRQVDASHAAFERAKSLSASASEKDRLATESIYALLIEEDGEKHRRILTELTTKYPKEKRAFCRLGVYYRGREMFDDAEAAFQKAIALDPNYGEPLNGIAYLYLSMGDYRRSIEYFERYAALNPGDANPFDSMGEAYLLMGDLKRAVAMYERALDIKPGFGSEHGLAYIAALREDYSGAIAVSEQFIAATPTPGMKAAGQIRLAYFLGAGCRWEKSNESQELAVQTFEQIGHKFGVAGILWMEACHRYLMGDYTRSLECLEESGSIMVAIDRTNSWFTLISNIARGLIDLKEGRVDEAKARLDDIDAALPKVAVDEPTYVQLAEYHSLLFRAEILLAEGSLDECIEVLQSLPLPDMPALNSAGLFFYNQPTDRDVLARAYVAKGAVDDAIAEYERLITYDPDSKDRRLIYPLFHFRLGVLYEENGQAEKAAQQYEKFLEIIGDPDPTVTEAPDARRRLAALTAQ